MDENKLPIVLPVVIDNFIAKPRLKTEPAHIWCLVYGVEIST